MEILKKTKREKNQSPFLRYHAAVHSGVFLTSILTHGMKLKSLEAPETSVLCLKAAAAEHDRIRSIFL